MMGMTKFKRAWTALLLLMMIGGLLWAGPRQARAEEESLRIGVFELRGFYERGADDQPTGYGVDYLDKLAEKTGWQYQYVWADTWDECVDMLRSGQVDMIAPAEKSAERLAEFIFSGYSIGMECGALVTRADDEGLIYEDFAAFDQMRVGIVDTLIFKDAFLQYAQHNGFTPRLVSYESTQKLLAALASGEVDGAVVNLFVKNEDTKVLGKFGVAPFYLMLGPDDSNILRQLDDALQQIKIEFPDFETKLLEQYYPAFNDIPFTRAELDYIAGAPVLNVACRTAIRPISDVDGDGNVLGITRDILDRVAAISGLRFNYVPLPAVGAVSYDDLRRLDVDLISSVEQNRENTAIPGMKLTIPYFSSQKVFVCGEEGVFDADAPLRLAVATGSETLEKAVMRAYPSFQITIYPSARDCFEAVRKGQADALLQNQYVVATYLTKPIYAHMITVPVEGLDDDHCLSPLIYQSPGQTDPFLDDDRLISVLNKSIRRLSEADIAKIIIKDTTEQRYQYTIGDFCYQYRYPLLLGSVILLILAAQMAYVVRLKHHSHQRISESEAMLRNIANNINGGVVVLAACEYLRITYANEGFLELLKCRRDDCQHINGADYKAYVHPDDAHILQEIHRLDLEQNNQISVKLRILCQDGHYVPTLFNGTLTENAQGQRELYCVIMDNSEQEALLQEISLEKQKYDLLIENAGEIIFEVNCRANKLKVSPLFAQKFGWQVPDGYTSGNPYDLLHLLRIHEDDQLDVEAIIHRGYTQKENMECAARIQKADGSYLWCRLAQYPMVDAEGALVYIIGKIMDIDDEVRAREKLEHMTRTDPLTGLLNKSAFFTEAQSYLAAASGNTALIFIDIDNFKQVNDQLGHMIGDTAIKDTAKRLQLIFSHYDLIARFGGDEFCVLLKEIPQDALVHKLTWALDKLRTPYTGGQKTILCTVSIGAASTGGRPMSLEDLLHAADAALYLAKAQGRDQFVIAAEEGGQE